MKNDVNVPSKSKKLKGKNFFFGGILKTTDERKKQDPDLDPDP